MCATLVEQRVQPTGLLACTKPRQEALAEEHQHRRSRAWAEEPLFFPM